MFLRLTSFICILLIINSVLTSPVPEKEAEKPKEEADSAKEDGDEKAEGTISPEEIEKLEEEIVENQEENAEKFDLPLTSKPEVIETFLKEEEKELGEQLPEKVEEELAETETDDEAKNLVNFLFLFNKIESEGSEKEEVVEKSPAEMKEMKENIFKLVNELNKKKEHPEVSQEEFNKLWNKKKKESGELFPGRAEKVLVLLKENLEETESTNIAETTTEGISEAGTITSTEATEIKEEPPTDTFALRNAKGNICILAKFHSSITITYAGKSSEQKVEVSVPHSAHTKGKCRGPHGSALLQITWEKFIFSLHFNKTTEDSWGASLIELTYDTSVPLFDGATEREKVTVKSKKSNLFETPFGKSYFCPAQEVILLYREDQHLATVRLKEIHLQPYDVEDGKFSPSHRCNQVVIGGPDEEPFVQDETVPLAVGCTLALITLLILVGFSVHRAYNAAKVDYNTME